MLVKLKLCIQEITSVIYLYLITLEVISLLLQLYCNADTYRSVTLLEYKMTFVNLFAMGSTCAKNCAKLLKLQNKCHHDLVKYSPPPPLLRLLLPCHHCGLDGHNPYPGPVRNHFIGRLAPLFWTYNAAAHKDFIPRDSFGVSLHELENWRIRKIIFVCNLKGNIHRFVFNLPVYGTFQTEITHHIGWPRTNSQIHVVGDEKQSNYEN